MPLVSSLALITTLALVLLAPNPAVAQAEFESDAGARPAEAAPAPEADQQLPEEPEADGAAALPAQPEPHRSPPSAMAFTGSRIGKLGLSFFGGWPGAGLELDYGASDILGAVFRFEYLYGAPYGGFRTASAVSIELGTRLSVLDRGRVELTFEVDAGAEIALDRDYGLLSQELVPGDQVRPFGVVLNLGLTVSWRVIDALALKLGLTIPTRLVLSMVEAPYQDDWELIVPFAARVGSIYRLRDWISFFALIDVGPAVEVTSSAWTSEGYEREVGVGLYFNAIAGVTFAPWR